LFIAFYVLWAFAETNHDADDGDGGDSLKPFLMSSHIRCAIQTAEKDRDDYVNKLL